MLEYLSELQPVPSVGLQDVPRESVGEHLGFGSAIDSEPMDELDERVARKSSLPPSQIVCLTLVRTEHTRFVYDLQQATAAENESDEDDAESFSDDSSVGRRHRTSRHSRRRTRKRMSIMTNGYYDVPRPDENGEEVLPDLCAGAYANGATKRAGRRRFFQSAARWDPVAEKVLVEWDLVQSTRSGMAVAIASLGRDWPARNGYAYAAGGEEENKEEEAADEEMEVDDEDGEEEG